MKDKVFKLKSEYKPDGDPRSKIKYRMHILFATGREVII